MQMEKRTEKFIMALIIMLVVTVAFARPVLASDGGAVDLTRSGSISVTLLDSVGKSPVAGAELTLYRVAGAYDSGYRLAYTLTDDFAACGISLDNLSQNGLATHLAAYADEKGLSGAGSETTDANGRVSFSHLDTGLYLVKQTKAASGYYSTDPFLVSVPMTIDSKWVYDVDASPKAEARPDSPGTPTTRLTVKKVWVSNGAAVPSAVTIVLLRDGVAYKTAVLNEANGWNYTWSGLDTNEIWDVAERDVPNGYKVSYSVSGSMVTITNTSTVNITKKPVTEKPTSSHTSKLIQTGQLNWPIPVLAGVGILLFAVGWALVLAKRKNRDD